MMKISVSAALVCTLVVSCAGILPASATEYGADNCSVLSANESRVVVADTRTEVIGFKELSSEVISHDSVVRGRSGNMSRATGRIEWSIPSETVMKADNAYSLEADEIVTINCTYSPRTADIDFGFITQDDTFHFTSGSNGNIKINIKIEETGKYCFAVRNNEDKTVEVLGYVYY